MKLFGVLIIWVGLALGSPIFAQDFSYSVNRGETIRIFSWSFFGDTCRVIDYPKIRAVRGGSLGTLSSGRGPIKINRVSDTRLSNCIGKTVKGTVVNYTAGATPGVDDITLGRERMGGNEARHTIRVTVK